MKTPQYYKKDELFIQSRRTFLRNAGLLFGALGVAPHIKIDFLNKLASKVGFNSLYAAGMDTEGTDIFFEICWRLGFNPMKLVQPNIAFSGMDTTPPQAHIWAGSKEAGTPTDINMTKIQFSKTNNLYLPEGVVFNNLKDIDLAVFAYNRGGGGHSSNFAIRNGVNNVGNEVTTGKPCPAFLHAAMYPRKGVLRNIIRCNLSANNGNVQDNQGVSTLTSIGLQLPAIENVDMRVVNGNVNITNLINVFSNQINLGANFSEEQKKAMANLIEDLTRYRATKMKLQNASQVIGAPEAVSRLLKTSIADQLTLSDAEKEAWGAQRPTFTGVSGGQQNTYMNYNLGLVMGTLYKAAKLGLAQTFILYINEGDQHAEQEGDLQQNAGWQKVHKAQGENLAKMLGELYRRAKEDDSPYGNGKLWNNMTLAMYSEYGRTGRTNEAGGSTDSGDGKAILAGGKIKGGVYHNYSSDFATQFYQTDLINGIGELSANNQNRPTQMEAYAMVSRAIVGDTATNKVVAPATRMITYHLKK